MFGTLLYMFIREVKGRVKSASFESERKDVRWKRGISKYTVICYRASLSVPFCTYLFSV
mgnify:CR=1 FL=1